VVVRGGSRRYSGGTDVWMTVIETKSWCGADLVDIVAPGRTRRIAYVRLAGRYDGLEAFMISLLS
jgi:hypothetical protein